MDDSFNVDNRGDFGLWAIEAAKQIIGDQGSDLAIAALLEVYDTLLATDD